MILFINVNKILMKIIWKYKKAYKYKNKTWYNYNKNKKGVLIKMVK